MTTRAALLDPDPDLARECAVAAACSRIAARWIGIRDRGNRAPRIARLRDTAHASIWRRAIAAIDGGDVVEARLLLVAAGKIAAWHGESDADERRALDVLDGE